MKRLSTAFLALLLIAGAFSFAQSDLDFDTEIKENEADARASKKKRAVKRTKRAGEDVFVQKGLVRLETVRNSGAVLFYVANGKKLYPAVDSSGYGESTYISLYAGAREYRLNKDGRCDYHFEVGENSITEFFTVKGVAELKAVYTIGKMSPKDELENSVDVKYYLNSLADKKCAFMLKAVYNLRLGENRKAHFSSALKSEIGSEYVAFPSSEESWIISSDSQNAVEFIIYGDGVTPPRKAVMANKDTIELSTPATVFEPGRPFDSLLSYNNSSLALFWNAVELGEKDMAKYSYKINFSVSDFQNSGKLSPRPEKADVAIEADNSAKKADEAPKEDSKEKPKDENELSSEIDYIDPSKLNEEYVQQLIDHINSLEQSDPSLNKLKIQQLQTEVDDVLQVLRSRK